MLLTVEKLDGVGRRDVLFYLNHLQFVHKILFPLLCIFKDNLLGMKWTLKKTVSKKVIDKSEPALENIILKDRQTGFIDYGRMKKREKFHKMQTVGNPHPKRFISFNAFPSSSTRAK